MSRLLDRGVRVAPCHFAKCQLPDDVIFVDSIPRTGMGKMDQKAVRGHLKAGGYQLPDLRGTSAERSPK